jgi:mannose-6-phosphate isomerase class I
MSLTAEPGKSSVQVLVCLEGGAIVEAAGAQALPLMQGEAAIIPAASPPVTVRPQWKAELLRMRLPAQLASQPETILPRGTTSHH